MSFSIFKKKEKKYNPTKDELVEISAEMAYYANSKITGNIIPWDEQPDSAKQWFRDRINEIVESV